MYISGCMYSRHLFSVLLLYVNISVAKEAVNIREKNVECADNKHIHITVEKWERNCSVSRPVLCDLPDSLYLMPSLPSTQESEEGRSEESTANKEHRQSDDPDETKVKVGHTSLDHNNNQWQMVVKIFTN